MLDFSTITAVMRDWFTLIHSGLVDMAVDIWSAGHGEGDDRGRPHRAEPKDTGKYAESDGASLGLYLWVRTPAPRIFRYTLNGKAHAMALSRQPCVNAT